MIISKIKSGFKYLLQLPSALLQYIKYWHMGRNNEGKCNVIIDTTGLDNGRRMAQIVLMLRMAGFRVGIIIPFYRFLRYQMWMGEYTNIAFSYAKILFLSKNRSNYLFTVCSKYNASDCKKLIIEDDILCFKDHIQDCFFFPILMHPLKMIRQLERDTISIPDKRFIGVLFIGNASELYNVHENNIHSQYHLYTRNEVLNHIKTVFINSIIEPHSLAEWNEIIEREKYSLRDKIVIFDKIRMEGYEYEKILCSSYFHLWTVGVMQPYCHNQVESMSCGCIPIFQKYPYYPGLVEGHNCFSYNGFDQMDEILEKITKGKIQNEILLKMSEAIFDNYNKRFSKAAIKEVFENYAYDEARNKETMYICPKIVRE